jgi:hypothetical protein
VSCAASFFPIHFGSKLDNMRRSWALAVAIAFAIATGMTGCSNAGPPLVVCGTTLSNSPAVPVTFDATRPLAAGNDQGPGGLIYIMVARGCDHGSHVTWDPSAAARLVKAAYAQDGQPVVVVLQPCGESASFRLTATQNGKIVASATVQGAVPDPAGGPPC